MQNEPPLLPSGDDLLAAARGEGERPARSRLEPYREAIVLLRTKRWSYGEIARWLAERGIPVAESTVQRFHRSRQERAVAAGENGRRRPAVRDHDGRKFFENPDHKNLQTNVPKPDAPRSSRPRTRYNVDF